jgi:hypothetical protein
MEKCAGDPACPASVVNTRSDPSKRSAQTEKRKSAVSHASPNSFANLFVMRENQVMAGPPENQTSNSRDSWALQ